MPFSASQLEAAETVMDWESTDISMRSAVRKAHSHLIGENQAVWPSCRAQREIDQDQDREPNAPAVSGRPTRQSKRERERNVTQIFCQ